MNKKRVERQEVMRNAGNPEKELEEIKKSYSQNEDPGILVTPDYTAFFTIVCC